MTKFVCKDCDYRVELIQEDRKKICPYCGSEKLKKELDAEGLLGEVEEE